MDTAKLDLIKLLKIYLNQGLGGEQIVGREWKRIFEYAKKHSVTGMVSNAISFLPEEEKPDLAMQNVFQQEFATTVMVGVSQEMAMEEVISILNERGILHILIKGYVLKGLYPISELRSMGDIDFLIREEQRQECHEAMLALGFTCTLGQGFVWCYERGNVMLEIHTKLIAGDCWRDVDMEAYYNHIFDHMEQQEDFTYCLKKEYHLVYLMTHAAKHFRGAGYGIRGMMDFVVFLRVFGKELDWEEVWRQLDILKLRSYTQAVFELCERWFGEELLPQKSKLSLNQEAYELFTQIIFEGGTYGYCGRNMEHLQVRNEMNDRKKIGMAKIQAAWKAVFPSYRYMRERMEALEKYPVLLPVAWIVRWYEAIFKRGRRNADRIKNFVAPDSGITEEYELLRKLELL